MAEIQWREDPNLPTITDEPETGGFKFDPSIEKSIQLIKSLGQNVLDVRKKILDAVPEPVNRVLDKVEETTQWAYENHPVGYLDKGVDAFADDASQFVVGQGAPEGVGTALNLAIQILGPGPGGKADAAMDISRTLNRARKLNVKPPNLTPGPKINYNQPAYATVGGGGAIPSNVSDLDGLTSSAKPLAINIETPFTRIKPGMTTEQAIKAAGDTSWFKGLNKKYQYLKPEQIVGDSKLVKKMQYQESLLVATNKKVDGLKAQKTALLNEYPNPKLRSKEINNKIDNLNDNISKYSKEITEIAGDNPLLEGIGDRRIFGKDAIRKYLKKEFPEFNDNLNRWHHEFGSADVGKSHLTDLTQNPWIKLNLYAHMKKNNIFSSGTVNNLVLIKEVPHNKWHQYAKSMGLEPEYFVSAMNRWVNSDLTFFQYIEDISKEVIAGNTDINELFTIVDAYGRAQRKINQKLFTPEFGGKRFRDISGITESLGERKITPSVLEKQALKNINK